MTVVTVRPRSTGSSDFALTGAATLHGALSDNSDTSYGTGSPAASSSTPCAVPVIPSGGLLKSVAARLRAAATSSAAVVELYAKLDGVAYSFGTAAFDWATPTTIQMGSNNLSAISTIDDCSLIVKRTRVYELYLDFTYVGKPVVRVTAPASRATVTDTNLPTISWANTLDADGGPQTYYAVYLFSAAQYGARGFDPSTSARVAGVASVPSSATRWAPTIALPDGTYRAYVSVAQTVNGYPHVSDWAYGEFTIDVDLPGSPALTVTPAAANGAHRLDIACDTVDPTATDRLEIEYSYDDGETWAPLRTVEGSAGLLTPVSSVATAWDFEAPNGTEATYRVRALHDYGGVVAASDWVEAAGMWLSPQEWLSHPLDPSQNLRVVIQEHSERQRAARRGVFQALGSSDPLIVADDHGGEVGTTVFQIEEADRQAFRRLVEEGVVLLLRGAEGSAMEFPLYLSPGDLGRVEGNQKGYDRWTLETVSWARANRPRGGLLATPV